MKALITGASSGIGRDLARVLSAQGHDLILVARRKDRLQALQRQLPGNAEIIVLDLAEKDAPFELYRLVRGQSIDILINNAGLGAFGAFEESPLGRELEIIDVNIRAVHILTKLFLRDFKRRDSGYILNVASSAAFLPGPLMAAYYASKAYVLRLTQAVYKELRKSGSHVYIGALCPGPVNTEFSRRAGVVFSVRGLSSMAVAKYAVDRMLSQETVIVPGQVMKAVRILSKILPDKLLLRGAYYMQKRKRG